MKKYPTHAFHFILILDLQWLLEKEYISLSSVQSLHEPDSTAFALEALEVGINGLWNELLNQCPEIPTRHVDGISCVHLLPFTIYAKNGVLEYVAVSPRPIPTLRPLRGSASQQLRRKTTTWDESLVNLVWGIEWSLERYVNAVWDLDKFG